VADTATIDFDYHFKFDDAKNIDFKVSLDKETLSLIPTVRVAYPEWARLDCHQCDHCPLNPAEHEYCPVAANLVDVVEAFQNSISYEEADITIVTKPRTYSKRASLQTAIGSLIGIYMVTSGCAVMDKLRPMVKMHLPFATMKETFYRAVAMYLVAQFLLSRKGKEADWKLENLHKIYEDIRIVNRFFAKRLTDSRVKDASINALVVLDCFADHASFILEEEKLEELERHFSAYLNEDNE